MAIPPGGTFAYVGIAPSHPREAPWRLERSDHLDEHLGLLATLFQHFGPAQKEDRLVGDAPTLTIEDAGWTPNPGWDGGVLRPKVLRSRLTLTAASRRHSTARFCSFFVDRALLSRVLPGDVLYLTRTGSGGVGISLLREDILIFAVGCVTHVPLGPNIRASLADDLVREIESLFQKRDPEFHFPEIPVEVRFPDKTILRFRGGRAELYEVNVFHGVLPGLPGRDECAAIWRVGECPDVAASASAELLDIESPEIGPW